MFCQRCGARLQQTSKVCPECGTQQSLEQLPTTHAISPQLQNDAGFWLRALAAIIDGGLVEILGIILILSLAFGLGATMAETASQETIETMAQGLGFGVGFLTQWLWYTAAESSNWQATVGKKILGLKVTDERGNGSASAEPMVAIGPRSSPR